MSNPFDIIFIPFGWILRSLYFLLHSYGLAIIVFCLITKIILFPLSLKGKKSMIKMNALSAKQQQLQKQYGKDKNRLNAEIQKLYEKENVNPMGGCLWSLLPLPILMGLYGVIQKPLQYMMGLTSDEVNELSNFLFGQVVSTGRSGEITVAEELFHRFQEVISGLPSIADKLFSLNFNFLGINLAQTPQWNPMNFDAVNWNNIGLFLIPIISAVLALVSMQISLKTNGAAAKSDNPLANNKSMMITMPLISLWIGFTLPAALGIYWVANSVFTMLQELLAGRILKKDFEAAARDREERDRQEKEEEKDRRRQAAEVKAKAIAEGKKRQSERKISGDVLASSRSGIRAYARGRNYDPNRFGSVTAYRDPNTVSDEAAGQAAPTAAAEEEISENTAAPAALPGTPEDKNAPAASPTEDAGAVPSQEDTGASESEDYEAEAEESEEEK